jgi:hypothetical protein
VNFWTDGDESSAIVGDKGYDLGSRFAITGSAQIAPGWSGGFNLTILATSDLFATSGTLAASNQLAETGGTFFDHNFNPLYSYIYIKSDTLGTLNWGHLSPASDNPAVLADISGTVIESNGVFFEGASFFLRSRGGLTVDTLGGSTGWEDFLRCQGLGAGIGVDCWGAAMPAVRYDSPTWGGFRFEASWGKNTLTAPNVTFDNILVERNGVANAENTPFLITTADGFIGSTVDANFADVAVFYTADWNSIKVSAAYAYTWIETGAITGDEVNLHQAGASIWHKPSGLGIYGMYQLEEADGAVAAGLNPLVLGSAENAVADGNGALDIDEISGVVFGSGFGGPLVTRNVPETDAWYVKPFWRKTWSPIGATVLYGEYGQYNDQFAAGRNLCLTGGFAAGTDVGDFCATQVFQAIINGNTADTYYQGGGVFVTGSEVERWGLGVVQEIDSAAMHLWARWQHQELDASFIGYSIGNNNAEANDCFEGNAGCEVTTTRLKDSFDDWDLFQVGGIIFF